MKVAIPLLLCLVSCSVTESTHSDYSAEIFKHTNWLADDSLEGRRAGTPMADKAASYLAAELMLDGLEPAGEGGGWYQAFPIALASRAGSCSLSIDGQTLEGIGTLALSAEGEVSAPLASAEYGVVLESYNIDHFADVETEGKIVLLRRYTEWGPNADSTLTRLGAIRSKVRNARAAGAVGVILGTHPDDVAQGGDAVIPFTASHGTGGIPIVTVSPETFVLLETQLGKQAVLAAELEKPTAETLNVLAMVPGKSDSVISLGAHYDHLGWGGEGSLAPGVHAIHNGADDNASGSAVLLEIAEAVAEGPQPEHTLLFCFWGAEEEGLIGSKYWVENPTVALDKVLCNINLDMVGRLQSGGITVGSHSTASAFKPALAHAGSMSAGLSEASLQLNLTGEDLPGGGGSDHMSFHSAEIPALFFFSGLHADYHKPSDDSDKLDYPRMGTLVSATLALIDGLEGQPEQAFDWVKPAPVASHGRGGRQGAGGGVWFGSIPDYAGEEGGGSGMKLAGTVPGGPAEAAGFLKDDVLTAINDFAIQDIYDFMDSLREFKDGETVTVHFRRNGENKTLELTFFPRPSGD